ncbi:MAG: hypothetical protein QXY75_05965 [Candidatus Bathyarchaeia archaeon]
MSFLVDPSFIGVEIDEGMIPKIQASLAWTSIANPLSVKNVAWIFSSFLIPIFAYSALLLDKKKKRLLIPFAYLSLISVFLSLGTNSPFPGVYKWICFDSPFSSFGWLFRSPSRWQIFTSLAFSILCGFSTFWISEKVVLSSRLLTKTVSIIVITLFIVGTVYFFYPVAKIYADHIYSPVEIPPDYNIVNDWLSNDPDDFKVLWLPSYPPSGYFPSWAPDKRIGGFSIISCDRGSISSFPSILGKSYLQWLEDSVLRPRIDEYGRTVIPPVLYRSDIHGSFWRVDYVGRIVAPLGVKYLILDMSMEDAKYGILNVHGATHIKPALDASKDLELVLETKFLRVYKNLAYTHSGINALDIIIPIESMAELVLVSQTVSKFADRIAIIEATEKPQRITMLDYTNCVKNPSFEDGWNITTNSPNFWSFSSSLDFTVSLDETTSWSGKYSLRLETTSNKSYNIGWVIGNEIAVNPGEWYLLKVHMKWNNVQWAHFVVYGYDTGSREWKQLLHCPGIQSGSSDWKEYIGIFKIPDNISAIRPQLAGGWVRDRALGNGITWFDDISILKLNPDSINKLALRKSAEVISYQKIDQTKCIVKVNATEPFMLSFAESYDPLWFAYVNGERIQSIPLYGVINGFWINQTGLLEISIVYEPQKWFYMGSIISVSTLIACITYLIYDWIKKKDIIERIKKRVEAKNTIYRSRNN